MSELEGDPADETGEPIRELEQLHHEAEPDLLPGVRRSILRRVFAGDMAELSWSASGVVFLELLRAIVNLLKRSNQRPEDRTHA